jgi:hypothetical protein
MTFPFLIISRRSMPPAQQGGWPVLFCFVDLTADDGLVRLVVIEARWVITIVAPIQEIADLG